jgi:Asparagine synthase/Glutamine amidotransferase domain
VSWVALVKPAGRDLRFELVAGSEQQGPGVFASDACTVVVSGSLDVGSLPSERSARPAAERVHDAYLRDHTQFLPQLRGSFALVVWDPGRRTLLAVRDPMGAHPLFYSLAHGGIAISPSVEAVSSSPVSADPVAAAAYVVGRPLPAARTLLADVRRLPPGHVMEFRLGAVNSTRYWQPDLEPRVGESNAESLVRFQEALSAAIERFAPSLDGLGVYLSGGLDSASIAVVATDICRRDGLLAPAALMMLYRGHQADEEVVQRTVADALGMKPLARTPDELLTDGLLASALDLARTTPGGPPELIEGIYDRLALLGREEEGCAAVLSGMGGDDWLLPPPSLAADSLRRLDISPIIQLARAWRGYWPGFGGRELVRDLLLPFALRPLLREPAVGAVERVAPSYVRARRRNRVLASLPDWLVPDRTLRAEFVAACAEHRPAVSARDHVTRSRLRLLDHATPSMIQEALFAAKQRIGIPVLAPLLDPDVVSVITSIPPVRLVAHGRAKALAAELAGSRVPAYARHWPPTVYGDSLWARTITSEGTAAWSKTGGAELLAAAGVVDRHLLEQRLRQKERRWSAAESTWLIRALILEVWLQGRILPA